MGSYLENALDFYGDYSLFIVNAVLLMALVHVFVFRKHAMHMAASLAWLVWLALMGCAFFSSHSAVLYEKKRLREMVEGYAPTYAQELQLLGHAKVGLDTAPDDPIYLVLVEAEKRWLIVNERVKDIYTLKKQSDGRIAVMVDSETDFDRNGRFQGDMEQRLPIGVPPFHQDPLLEAAFTGKPEFADHSFVSRWGVGVSAFCPILNDEGEVDGVVVVDFDAEKWQEAIARARRTVLSYFSFLIGLIAAAAAVGGIMLLTRQNNEHRRTAEMVERARNKLQSLINSIDGVVWEWELESGRYVYVSDQGEKLLKFPLEEWLERPDFWVTQLHEDDRELALRQRMEAANTSKPYDIEYRMRDANGDIVWVRERGVAMHEQHDSVLLRGIVSDITSHKVADEQLETLNQQLVETSREAGMAEVATGVLHNVGNVLNSINVSGAMIVGMLRESKLSTLSKVAQLMNDQNGHLPEFFASDPRGQAVPGLLSALVSQLSGEQIQLQREMNDVMKNVTHIKEIVMTQQNYAVATGKIEVLEVVSLMEDALRINEAAFTRDRIRLVRDYKNTPPVLGDRSRVLQILVNLLQNAQQAMRDCAEDERAIVLNIDSSGGSRVKIRVIDNGVGIAPDNIGRLFSYGFTTRKNGHGFGLHSGAAAAREMGGQLTAHSEGIGKGSTFTLELSVAIVTSTTPSLHGLS